MSNPTQPHARGPRRSVLLAVILIALGLALTAFFGVRAMTSFQRIQYIREQGLDRGTASVGAIKPWMTIRFVAVAYAVPEEYLYSSLVIPFERRNADRPLGQLNRDYKLGTSANGDYPAIIDSTKAAIIAYRANPVVTGLRDVRPWMSLHYIANSTGVPESYLFQRIGVPSSGNSDRPLDLLAKEQHYPHGPEGLATAIAQALAAYPGK
jgi:hypothetical protein